MSRSAVEQAAGLAGWLLASGVAGGLGAAASTGAAGVFQQLTRPAWAPPAWLFGPVWTVLYAMMAIAAWLIWRARGFAGARAALWLYVAQLAANALWSWLFFAWRQGALALGEIVLLWLLVAATIAAFWRVRPLAGALLLPYLAWVTFAAALTIALWRLNPALL
ncbi:MAG TPA: TspO/MBR family protein [Longimicrobium sp.]|nr:TspO/MBR family protein [Longimicrobium sp.]